MKAKEQRFHVVFEDRQLLVVEKSAGLLTVPTPQGEENTLVDLLDRYLSRGRSPRHRPTLPRRGRDRHAEGRGRPLRTRLVEIVHRLDRDTSGLLVFAKDRETADALRGQFRDHSADRIYLAILSGIVRPDEGTFDTYMATNRGLHRYSTGKPEVGERAITHYRVRLRGLDTTCVEVRLETGRRNQIRVHFAEAGHPVLGDSRYGSRETAHPHWPPRRLALHATALSVTHPVTGERLRWESPMPKLFQSFLTRQEQRANASHRDPGSRGERPARDDEGLRPRPKRPTRTRTEGQSGDGTAAKGSRRRPPGERRTKGPRHR